MKLRTPLAITATLAAVLAGTALPASAADTVTTFSVNGGSLSVTAQPSAGLAPVADEGTTTTGSLGAVTVTDDRSGVAGWVASATSTAFSRAGGGSATTGAISYTTGTVATSGTVTATAAPVNTDVQTVVAVVTATAVSGDNTASWTPDLSVTLPVGALTGVYTGTVTTSVA